MTPSSSAAGTVRRSQVLDELSLRTLPDGRRRIFSIKFVTKSGKLYYFPRAFSCGSGRMDQHEYRMVGIRPCDCVGNPEGHVTAVVIDNIIQFDGRRVVFGNEQVGPAADAAGTVAGCGTAELRNCGRPAGEAAGTVADD